jgi:hypothetical protein
MDSLLIYTKKHMTVVISISVVLVLLGIGLSVYYFKYKKEGYKTCVCSSRQGGCAENCQDNQVVEDAYAAGTATEFSDFKSPGWNRGPQPGSTRFPSSCNGAPYGEHPNFGPWDFSDFAN